MGSLRLVGSLEAARLLKVDRSYIPQLVQAGKLTPVETRGEREIPYFAESDVAAIKAAREARFAAGGKPRGPVPRPRVDPPPKTKEKARAEKSARAQTRQREREAREVELHELTKEALMADIEAKQAATRAAQSAAGNDYGNTPSPDPTYPEPLPDGARSLAEGFDFYRRMGRTGPYARGGY